MRRLFRSPICIGAACAIVPATALLAQNPSVPPAVATAHKTHWCFRGRPKPACDVFWLTEFGAALAVPYGPGSLYTGELGWMMNRGKRLAFGVAGFVESNSEIHDGGIGIRPRLRWWITPDISVDVAPGIMHRSRYFDEGPRSNFSGHVGLNFGDYAALTAHVVARRDGGGPDVFVGGRVGSALGAIVVGAWLVLIAVLSRDHS